MLRLLPTQKTDVVTIRHQLLYNSITHLLFETVQVLFTTVKQFPTIFNLEKKCFCHYSGKATVSNLLPSII